MLISQSFFSRLGTQLKYSTSHHPQTDGLMEVVNRSLGILLRSLIKKNIQHWKSLLPYVEFSNNKSVNRTIIKSPFEVVFGKNPLGPLDLHPLVSSQSVSSVDTERVKQLKTLHEKIKAQLEKQMKKYKCQADKHKNLFVS